MCGETFPATRGHSSLLFYISPSVEQSCTWPANTVILVDPLQAGGSMFAGVRGTFRNIFLTVVADKACRLTVTFIAAEEKAEVQTSLSQSVIVKTL